MLDLTQPIIIKERPEAQVRYLYPFTSKTHLHSATVTFRGNQYPISFNEETARIIASSNMRGAKEFGGMTIANPTEEDNAMTDNDLYGAF